MRPFDLIAIILLTSSCQSEIESNEQAVEKLETIPDTDLIGHWLCVKSQSYYVDHPIVTPCTDSTFIWFTADSIWQGKYPISSTWPISYSYQNDTIFEPDGDPWCRVRFNEDTLMLSYLDSRFAFTEYYLPANFDSEIVTLLKGSRINWQTQQYLWVLQDSTFFEHDCPVPDPEFLDLRASNERNYIFVDEDLLYIVGRDTQRYGYSGDAKEQLNLIHDCFLEHGIHGLDYKRIEQ